MFLHIVRSLDGFFGPLLVLLALVQFGLIVRLSLSLRRSALMPPRLLEVFNDLANEGDVREATLLARLHEAPLAEVLAAGLTRLGDGIDAARDGVVRRAESIRARLEVPLFYLAVVATLGPMIGVLGTVCDLWAAFQGLPLP